jgi:hypothetical protein
MIEQFLTAMNNAQFLTANKPPAPLCDFVRALGVAVEMDILPV